MEDSTQVPIMSRIVPMLFGLIFAAIGVTVIVSLWSDDDGFPPLMFRVVGSLISLVFVVMGGGMAISAMLGTISSTSSDSGTAPAARRTLKPGRDDGYTCPRCGAPLAADADVSPLGDVRCGHCGGWFNIHRRSAAG